MIARASQPASGVTATVVSLVTMVFGASSTFGQLQSSLNKIWDVKKHAQRRARPACSGALVAFSMILAIGALLFLSLAASAALSGVHGWLEQYFPVRRSVLPLANFVLSFAVVTALFAMIFKVLPDTRIEWRDVWAGAAVTALLFTIGKAVIGVYLGRAGVTSVYGAAGSLVLILLWIYYSAQLLFLGAEFTEVWSRRRGSRSEGGGRSGRRDSDGESEPEPGRADVVDHLGLDERQPVHARDRAARSRATGERPPVPPELARNMSLVATALVIAAIAARRYLQSDAWLRAAAEKSSSVPAERRQLAFLGPDAERLRRLAGSARGDRADRVRDRVRLRRAGALLALLRAPRSR